MTTIGYKLCSEEHGPQDLVRYARRAEEAGFEFAAISDHFHPWTDAQGESPFVWSVIGAIASSTERLRVGTAVTCPTIRIHPAIVAQAAATSAALLPGRFFLGVGTGEYLNEHILGDPWPRAGTRLEMLEEAIGLIRSLWEGRLTNHDGVHYVVENARIYSLPETPPPIVVAAGGPKAAALAGRIGDGLMVTAPEEDPIERFRQAGGTGKPVYGEMTVCWAESEVDASRTVKERWPVPGIPGQLSQELAIPAFFEQAAELVREEDLAEKVPVGPDPERHLEAIRAYLQAGIDHVYVHQVGPDQEGFFRFYEQQVLPKVG
jgi:coenzyme F420-dependent glucose-6-phosphate dehydrogenase